MIAFLIFSSHIIENIKIVEYFSRHHRWMKGFKHNSFSPAISFLVSYSQQTCLALPASFIAEAGAAGLRSLAEGPVVKAASRWAEAASISLTASMKTASLALEGVL
jgi:hypothetical protein